MKLSLAAILVLMTAGLAFASSFDIAGEATPPQPPIAYELPAGLPVVVSAQFVCRLVADNPSAADATVLGVDGAPSVEVNGTDYWFFGDTYRKGPGGRRDVIPAGFATSDDLDAHDCVDLTFKTDAQGIVQPMFPRVDETTAWPDGVLAMPDGSIIFYMVKTYRSSPTEWGVGGVGLGMLPAGSVSGRRLTERIWDDASGFHGRLSGVRSPVRIGDDVFVYINTEAGNYLARAPVSRIADSAAYTYWDGAGWNASPAAAQAMWTREPSVLPADNGLSVRFDGSAGKWVALYNADLRSLEVRLADAPWGPWSAPITWFDCQALWGSQYPYCYSSALHPELSRDGGSTLYATFSTEKPYDVALVELHMGVAVHAWRGEGGAIRYSPVAPDVSWEDAGIAFYASGVPAPGLAPVYDGAAVATLIPSSFDAHPIFYAYPSMVHNGPVHTRAVYRWERNGHEALDANERDGWTRGDVAFYVPCLDVIGNGSTTECAR